MLKLDVAYIKTAEKLIKFLMRFAERHEIRDRDSDQLYLVRYILFKSKPFSIYIHRFMCSDQGHHHDHPWNFFTYVATKGYHEERLIPHYEADNPWTRGVLRLHQGFREPGSLAYRKATDIHKVILDPQDHSFVYEDEEDAPLTVCFILKRHRIWGFVEREEGKTYSGKTDTTGHKWTNFQDYLGMYPDDPNFRGGE